MNALIKSRASSLNKLAQLPRYRHPADLLNQYQKPMLEQNQLINGQVEFGQNLYGQDCYQALIKSISTTRKQYREAGSALKKTIAESEYNHWDSYMEIKLLQLPLVLSLPITQHYKITDTQKNNIYETFLITKERNQERLTLNRLVYFFNQYSKGFKFDLQINPIIMMRLTYPHWGYLNIFPSIPAYKLQIDEIFHFLEDIMVASAERQAGNTLHSSQLLSFIFWKLFTRKFGLKQTASIPTSEFCSLLSCFKFDKVTTLNFGQIFSFSIQKGELQNHQDHIRFDLWRQIFLDRNL